MASGAVRSGVAGQEDDNYRVWRLSVTPDLATFYVESTASINIEVPYKPPTDSELPCFGKDAPPPQPLPETAAAQDLAAHLAGTDGAEVVFLVNGFNTSREESKQSIEHAYRAIHEDTALPGGRKIAFIGFRWPSERIFSPVTSSLTAASVALWIASVAFLLVIAIGSLAASEPGIRLPAWSWLPHGAMFWSWIEAGFLLGFLATLLVMSRLFPIPALVAVPPVAAAWLALWIGTGIALRDDTQRDILPKVIAGFWLIALLVTFAVPSGLLSLRMVVYFRDAYRATHYAVPDLLEFIRRLDDALDQHYERTGVPADQRTKANLSFIAHSMGAFVTTNLVRVLADVFDVRTPAGTTIRAASATGTHEEGQRLTRLHSAIGKHLCLGRLLMISPDISATALLTNRANFLHTALSHFEEIYLFSNEGDGVLRTTSNLANFFSFPTGRREHGYRLGNVEVLDNRGQFGIVNPDRKLTVRQFFDMLRVGQRTLSELYPKTNPREGAGLPPSHDQSFPSRFTYFDCTAYRDVRVDAPPGRAKREVGLLTWPTHGETIGLLGHTALLVQYLGPTPWRIDIHGGYFHGKLGQELIYRLACLGYAGLLGTYDGGEAELHERCEKQQIRVLLAQDSHTERAATR